MIDIRYCNEDELPNVMAEIGKEAQLKKMKINVIPQFVGANPVVYCFGTYDKFDHYHTIILMPRTSSPSQTASAECISVQDQV